MHALAALQPNGWTYIDIGSKGHVRRLGGGVAEAIDRIVREWSGRAARILTVDYWGVATWVYTARDATRARQLTEVASAVRYAPRLYEDARVLAAALAAQKGLRAFDYHAAHLRTGDRVPIARGLRGGLWRYALHGHNVRKDRPRRQGAPPG